MTHVPTLRTALQETADRRYRQHRRRRRLARLAPVVALPVLALVLAWPSIRSRPEVEAGSPRTVKVVRLKDLEPRVLVPQQITRDSAQAAYVAAGRPAGDDLRVMRAWSVPELGGPIFLAHGGISWCLAMPDPMVLDMWTSGCTTSGIYRRFGATLNVGDVYVAVPGPGLGAPTYTAPDGSKRTLSLQRGRIVVITRTATGGIVTMPGLEIERDDVLQAPAINRYQCSDGRSIELPDGADLLGKDPCASRRYR